MDKSKLVSIVLPVYNGEEFLKTAIMSVLTQTYKNLELIIVDDASTDSTPQIINHFLTKDSRVRVIKNQTNKNLPTSLNIGFAHAKGDYYTWVSDDDFYFDNAIEKMVSFLNSRPDVAFVYANCLIIDINNVIISERVSKPPYELFDDNYVGCCNLYRKEILEKIGGYDPEMFLVDDWDFFLRCYRYFKMDYINESLFCKRLHLKSLTGSRQEEIRAKIGVMLTKHVSLFISKWLGEIRGYGIKKALILANKINLKLMERLFSSPPAKIETFTVITDYKPHGAGSDFVREINNITDNLLIVVADKNYLDINQEIFNGNIVINKSYPLIMNTYNYDEESAKLIT
ncbi:MAG: glycosyltransferase [Clostridiales bacterium]|jgi:glycosyltransferase involved in cell wall biosynthesis|nr:glycosyltransferase [Clostridiales bacterium]